MVCVSVVSRVGQQPQGVISNPSICPSNQLSMRRSVQLPIHNYKAGVATGQAEACWQVVAEGKAKGG